LEAEAHGAEFFGELQRGMMVEDRALEAWKDARVIQEQYMSVGKLQAAKGISSRDSELAVMREVSRRRQSSESRPNTLGIWDTMGDSGSSVKNDNAGLNSMSTAHTANEDASSTMMLEMCRVNQKARRKPQQWMVTAAKRKFILKQQKTSPPSMETLSTPKSSGKGPLKKYSQSHSIQEA
jgi:hypothetical protein